MSNEKSQTHRTDKNSVKKAMELFTKAKKSAKRKKSDKDESDLQKYNQYCHPTISNYNKKSNSTAQAYSPSFVLTEMRLCLMRQDWVSLQKLFPILLECSSDREAIVWRYAFTILLHSPLSSAAHLEEFLNSCVGCQNDNLDHVLEQLITLGLPEKK